MVYSALFNVVFKALNLFLTENVSQCKTCSPAPFLKLIWVRWQSGQYSSLLGLLASVLCSTAARELHVSLTSKKTEKANDLLSIKIDRCWYI